MTGDAEMELTWADGKQPERPNRYIDWGVQNDVFPGVKGERWNPVLIRVLSRNSEGIVNKEILGENLIKLREEVVEASITLRMNDVERFILEDRIDNFDSFDGDFIGEFSDSPVFEFIIFLTEQNTYDGEGGFLNSDHYQILLAGPPVDGVGDISETILNYEKLIDLPDNAVVMGIIDDGIPFAHERFRKKDLVSSRIERLWIQKPAKADSGEILIGSVLDGRQIGGLLDENDQFPRKSETEIYKQKIGSDSIAIDMQSSDFPDTLIYRKTHGAHVMDLAAGFDPILEEDKAKKRPILAVELPQSITAATSGVYLPFYVLMALRYITNWADIRWHKPAPLVINFSYGITAGPKDGSDPFVRHIESIVAARNNRSDGAATILTMPSGNSYNDQLVAEMNLSPNQSQTIGWNIKPDDGTESYIEIWLQESSSEQTSSPVTLTIELPGQLPHTFPELNSNNAYFLTLPNTEEQHENQKACGVYFDCEDRAHMGAQSEKRYRSRILIAVNPTQLRGRESGNAIAAPMGRWKISLQHTDRGNTQPITVNIYVQRDDSLPGFEQLGRQSYLDDFDQDGDYVQDELSHNYSKNENGLITAEGTLNAIAGTAMGSSGDHVIMVGAMIDDDALIPIPASYTASGPTQANNGPRASAPVDAGVGFPGMYAAGSQSGYEVLQQGTSMAAPIIARQIADSYDPLTKKFQANGLLPPSDELCHENYRRLGKAFRPIKPMYSERKPTKRRRWS